MAGGATEYMPVQAVPDIVMRSRSTMAPHFLVADSPESRGLYNDIAMPGGPRGDSGIDLRFAEDILISPMSLVQGMPCIVDLKVRVRCIANGEFAPFQILPRSSIGKTPLGFANNVGVIDRGYQGSLKVALRNYSNEDWLCRRGDALFQLVRPDLAPALVTVVGEDHPAFVEATERGAGGFGSTGVAGTQ